MLKDKKAFIFFFLMTIILLDFATQLKKISYNPFVENLNNQIFQIVHVNNTGGAFGIFENRTMALTIFSIVGMIALGGLYAWLPRTKKMRPLRLMLTIIIAGGIGNIIDRIWMKKVTDMLSFDLINFPVFNVADIGVTIGAIVMCVLWIFYYKDEDFEKCKKSNS